MSGGVDSSVAAQLLMQEERKALYARQERDYDHLRRETNNLKAAAEAGDSEAKTILKTLRDEFSEDEDEFGGPTG